MLLSEINKEYKNVHGVYKITNIKDGKIYIGSTDDINRRIKAHYKSLKNGKHSNKNILESFKKNGEGSFVFDVLEIVKNKENLLKREQYWLDKTKCYKEDVGYNICNIAGTTYGIKHTDEQKRNNSLSKRKKHSELKLEVVRKIKGNINKKMKIVDIAKEFQVSYDSVMAIRKGISFSYVEPKIKEGLDFKRKLTEDDVIKIKEMLNEGFKVNYIAELFNVDRRNISSIKCGKTWMGVGEDVEVNIRRILKKDEVRAIKKMISDGFSDKEISYKYNCKRNTINEIRNGKKFKDVI